MVHNKNNTILKMIKGEETTQNQTGVCVVSSPLIIFKIVLFLLCTIKAS
jgi:hypothetical protein